tara:strand:+ start:426 stop:1406 length:981 start_codon:yes stop_codon:yes gene_type:complete
LKKFNRFGALAQLVEQWPFKPFVTGSNPVRPSFVLSILLTVLSLNTEIAIAENTLLNIKSDNNILLTGNLLSDQKNESVFLILHGTRGYKAMEIITSLAQRIYEEGHDTLRINLSYGINNREDTFLSCDIKHQHKEYESISEIITWYNYLLSKGYKEINFIGHSRGAFNIVQSLALLEKKNRVTSYLLAPVIDTYEGTKAYYENELKIPYDSIINSSEKYLISDRFSPINFLFCQDAIVSSDTFRSYLDFSKKVDKYPYTFGILDLLDDIESEITIISGTNDEILLDSYKSFNAIEKNNIRFVTIEDGDHFFRDIYLDEVIEIILE